MAHFAKFSLAGVANTAIGFGVIMLLIFWGMDDFFANVVGYAIGFFVSFILNRNFTFRRRGSVKVSELLAFAGCALTAYICNFGVLILGREELGEGTYSAQLAAIATYAIVFFILTSRFVFHERKS